MTPLLLLEVHRRGISLRVEGTDLRYRAPAGVVTAEVKELLAGNKAPLIELLEDRRNAASQTWAAAVADVGCRRNGLAAEYRARGDEPPSLGEARESKLQAAVAESIGAGELPRALAAIDRWRQAWLDLLAEPTQGADPAKERSWVRQDCAILGERAVLAPRAESVPAPRPIDSVGAEVEGRRLTPSRSVRDMFEEAASRFGRRAAEERGVTWWLRRNAPAVAALWPEAPGEAAWFDWLSKLGPEHLAILDQAWRGATNQKE